jgi:hypothetical protein
MSSSQNSTKQQYSNRRILDRVEPITKKMQFVRLFLGVHSFDAELVDFNPLGAGLELRIEPKLASEFVEGALVQGVIDMTGGSDAGQVTPVEFHGMVRSVRHLETHPISVLRLGLQFFNEELNAASKVNVPRVVTRLIVGSEKNIQPLPLCVYVDDVFKVNSLVGRIEDLSAYGARVRFETVSLPLIEKQKIWVEFILPILGSTRVFGKLAYLKLVSEGKWDLGIQFLESFGNCSDFIRDWIYLTRRDFSLTELKEAGFDLKEILGQGFGKRVVLITSLVNKKTEISFEDDSGTAIAKVKTNLSVGAQSEKLESLVWVELHPLVNDLHQLQVLALLRSFSLWASRIKAESVVCKIPGVEFSGRFTDWCQGKDLGWWAWFFGIRPTLG